MSFLKNLDQLREVGSTIAIRGMSSGFRMKDIVRSMQQDFIAYQGSLTTPPCSEAVSWLVARDPMKISRNDVSIFQTYLKHEIYIFLILIPDDRIQKDLCIRRNVDGTQLQTDAGEEQPLLLELLEERKDERTIEQIITLHFGGINKVKLYILGI